MEEIHMYKDNPMMHIEDIIETAIFHAGPLGWSIAGDQKSMDAVTRAAMLAYRRAYYVPSRTLVVAAGNIGPDALQAIEKLFGSILKKKSAKEFPKFRGKQTAARAIVEYKDTEQIQLALGFPAYSYFDKRLPALSILGNILGGTMSSRLFIKVRERMGLAYFVRASADAFEDTGVFMIRAGLTKSRIDEAIKAICKELVKIRDNGVTAAELKRAKENIRGRIVLELEDSSDLAGFFGKQELYTNEVKTPEEKFAEFNAVSVAEIKAVAKDVIRQSRASLALIGPFKDAKRFEKLIKL